MRVSSLGSSAPQPAASPLQQVSVAVEVLAPDRLLRFVKIVPALPVLDRMTLPDEHVKLLAPGLAQLGFSYEEGTLETAVGEAGTIFRFTLIKKAGCQKILLYLKDEVLSVYRREQKLALEEVRDLFQGKYEVLYVFHDSYPSALYKNLMQGEWPQKYRINVKFIPLIDLKGFAQLRIDEQVGYLGRELDLDAPPADPALKAPKLSPAEADPKEILRLIKIIAARPEFKDEGARGRSVFVSTAGLREFATTFNFDGGPTTVAGDLVEKLLKGGLRKLLEVLRDLEDLPSTDRDFVRDLLERYAFN